METDLGANERRLPSEACLGLSASTATRPQRGSDRAIRLVMQAGDVVSGAVRIEALLDGGFPFGVGSAVALQTGTLGAGLSAEWIVEFGGFLHSTTAPLPTAQSGGPENYRHSTDVVARRGVNGGLKAPRHPEVEEVRT